MAKELSRTFDLEHGAVFVQAQDALGRVAKHSIYVALLGGQTIDEAVAAMLVRIDAETAPILAAFQEAGWVGNPAG